MLSIGLYHIYICIFLLKLIISQSYINISYYHYPPNPDGLFPTVLSSLLNLLVDIYFFPKLLSSSQNLFSTLVLIKT